MSGYSDVDTCPNCGQEMECSGDYKPFNTVSGECYHCGFFYYTEVDYLDLEAVNWERKERDLEPLTELPEQKIR